jgi:hypothetical protein
LATVPEIALFKLKNMKKSLLLLFMIASIVSCKKKDEAPVSGQFKCATCTSQPQAAAANDASSKGVYKGVVSGSSGTISFNVMNSGTTITAIMVLDGTTVNLTSNVTWQAAQAYVAPFTGMSNGSAVSITFSVGATGGTPIVTTSSIPGHPGASFMIAKETSSSLIECFEGTYQTTLPETGTFNLLLSRTTKLWGAEARKTGATSTTGTGNGTISADNKLMQVSGSSSIAVGTLTADEIAGSSLDGNGKTVTIAAKRTL